MENENKTTDLKEIIAKNIIKYRKELKLTQLELAEKLNYSDKTLSKWERAESMPDITTLKQLADLFNVSVDVLISDEDSYVEFVPLPKKKKGLSKRKKVSISLLSIAIAWVVATIAFVITKMLELETSNSIFSNAWIAFIYAIPVTAIICLVYSSIWGNRIHVFFTTSFLIWSIALSFAISFNTKGSYLFYILAIPVQVMAFIYFIIYKKNKNDQN